LIVTRSMNESDLFKVYSLINTNLDGRFTLDTIGYFMDLWPEGQMVAVDLFGNIVGALMGSQLTNGRASISLFAVDSKYRGQGIGTRLFNDFRLKCFMSGYREIQLELRTTNSQAFNFYTKHGFVKTEDVPSLYGPGEDGYRMLLRINSASS